VPLLVAGLYLGGAGARSALAAGIVATLLVFVLCATAYVDLAWLFSGAIALAVFSGNWRQLGLPNLVSPDRLLLVVAFVAFLLRDPWLGRRARVNLTWTHVLMLLAASFALCSAIVAGTVGERAALYPLIDRFGIAPFLLFLCAPVVFRTARERRILSITFLLVGAYLGITAFCEGVGLDFLVFPRYILDPGYGFQPGRARGPFAESAVNGVALYYCAVAAIVAFATLRERWIRWLSLTVATLCLFDLIFTLQRSVWIGAVVATAVAALAVPQMRRRLVILVPAAVVCVIAAIAFLPGLHGQVTERVNDQRTTWDRKNLNTAAQNMFLARPLVGFGWGTFRDRSEDYFRQNPDYPLTNSTGEVHNVFLANAAELGLVGTTLWVLAFLAAIGGAIVVRGPPALYPWRIGLLAIALMWLIVANLIPMVQGFPNQVLWLWAGVVCSWRYSEAPEVGWAPVAPAPSA
jgi:O-antigen ligase